MIGGMFVWKGATRTLLLWVVNLYVVELVFDRAVNSQ